MKKLSSLLILFCLVLACKTNPTAPTQKPTVTGVTITSPNSTILVGQMEQMTATVTMSDGSTKTGSGTWGSDTLAVATINQSGLVNGVGPGEATIYFDATGGGRGTKKLRVIPAQIWTNLGQGNMVFDMPRYIERVRIIGSFTGNSSNFIVHIDGRLIVNELLGTYWNQTIYDGTHQTKGGVVEITFSSGVAWSFTEVR